MTLQAAAALVNTDQPDGDLLPDVDALDAFVHSWQWTGSRRQDRRELDEVRALPQLVAHDGFGYHLHATTPSAPLADRIAVETAMAYLDLVRMRELGRRRVCEADGCDDVHVDLSRNRSRRYCSTSCANRTNVAAFRARRATLPPSHP